MERSSINNITETDSKAKLVQAATQLFAHKGFMGVSIREIADRAGVNSALISYYFGGKEGLYAAALESQFLPIEKKIMSLQNKELTARETIDYYTRMVIYTHTSSPYLVQFLYSELMNPTVYFETIVKKYITMIYSEIEQALLKGIEEGELRPELQPQFTAIALAGIMNFYFIVNPLLRQMFDLTKVNDEKYASVALDIFLNGVGVNES